MQDSKRATTQMRKDERSAKTGTKRQQRDSWCLPTDTSTDTGAGLISRLWTKRRTIGSQIQ